MTFWEWYDRQLLAAKQYDVAAYELDWLVLQVTSLTKLDLRLRSPDLSQKITSELLTKLDRLWQKRLRDRIPVQYLIGSVTWRDLELQVSPAVLIPRPETELIIDIVIEHCQDEIYQRGIWVDLGTGSGAIAIALAQQFPQAQVHAIDLSDAALAIAKANALKYQKSIQQSIQFYQGSWFAPLSSLHLQTQVVGIISNPPYIPSAEVRQLQPEVKDHEPHLALDGGDDGLEAVRELVATAPQYLISRGFWIVEIMAGQAQLVRSLLIANGNYENIQIHQDYAGIERFVSAQLK